VGCFVVPVKVSAVKNEKISAYPTKQRKYIDGLMRQINAFTLFFLFFFRPTFI